MTNDRNIPHFRSVPEVSPSYLSEHKHPESRMLHLNGTGLIGARIALAIGQRNARWLMMVPQGGNGFACIGHFFFERIRPVTTQYPVCSLASYFILFWQLLTGRRNFHRPR